ncbi:MAG: magnesium transporter CorA family protein [Planctomycetota bacterium]
MTRAFQIIDRVVGPSANGDGPIIVHVNPDENERRALVADLGIDEHTLNSALDPDELARMEFEPDCAVLIYKRPRNYSSTQQMVFGVVSAGAFLLRDRLHIVIADETDLFDGRSRQRVDSLPGVVLRLLSRATGHFREHLRAINMVSDELQGEINRAMENKHLISLFSLEKSLVYYVNALYSNGALLEKLRANAGKIGLGPAEVEVLDDLIIDNNQCARQAEISSNILAGLMDARASIVANNLNVLMKRLNVITITIMVPTLVVSAFSMNVPIPMQDSPAAFYVIHVAALLSAAGFLYLWKRLGA